MATLTNTLKKANKVSAVKEVSGRYTFIHKGFEISFRRNGGYDEACNFYTKKVGYNDDIMTDYFCGTFHDNLSQAIRFVDNY
jgi:hypothetical protein